jgi:hypothetical protein
MINIELIINALKSQIEVSKELSTYYSKMAHEHLNKVIELENTLKEL